MANKLWAGTTNAWSTSGNWSPSGAPGAADNVRIDATSAQAIAGSDQSGTSLGAVEVDAGFAQLLGSAAAYLKLTAAGYVHSGTGLSYIDLAASAIAPVINNTASAATGLYGLYLLGSAMTGLDVQGGNVGIAGQLGETATIGTLRVLGAQANVTVGLGTTLTTAKVSNGIVLINCALTTLNIYGGNVYTLGSGTITTVNIYGGNFYPGSSGTITTLNCKAGLTDCRPSNVGFTVSTLNLTPGAKLFYDPATLTVSAWGAPASPIKLNTAAG